MACELGQFREAGRAGELGRWDSGSQAGPKGAGPLPQLGQRREQAVRVRGPEGRSWARLGCCASWAKRRGERAVQWIKREGMAWWGWCFVLGRKAFLFHSPISCPFLVLISILLYAMG